MDEQFLLRLSLLVSVGGILLLIFADGFYTLPQWKVEDITLDDAGKQVRIVGEITKSSLRSENLFLEVYDGTGKIPAVAFGSEERLDTGAFVELEGKIERYNGEPELIISKVTILDLKGGG